MPDSKSIEEVLVEERKLLRKLIDEIPDRIFVKDKECRFVLNNIAHIKALGAHSQSAALGKTDHDFRAAEFADRYLADDRKVLENDRPLYDYEEPTILPSGKIGTLLISKAPLHNSAGEVVGLIGISRDITERKHMEEALRASQDRYHALVDQSSEAMSLVDIDTQEVVEVNRRFTELFGFSLPEDAPLYVHQYVIDSKSNLDKIFGTTMKQQRVLSPECRIFRHKKGYEVPVERAGSIIDISGKDYLLASMRDMTAERRRQAELTRDVEFARQLQRSLLPELPESSFVTIRTLYHPSHFVSGDSYHLEWQNEGKLLRGFLLDVSGHGLATAIQTASVNVLLREDATSNLPLLGRMQRVNARATKYFTDDAAYAAILGFELDLSLRELRYIGCGITQFYFNGRKIETPGMFVGMWDNAEFTVGSVPITIGDSIHFLTDGYTDRLAESNNAGFWSPDGKDFDTDVAALKRLAESGTLRDDSTAVCLNVRELFTGAASKEPQEQRATERKIDLTAAHDELTTQYEALAQSQEAQRRSANIQYVLREIAEAAVLAVSLDELYAKVHRSVERVLPAKNLYISLLDETSGQITRPYCIDETNSVPDHRPVGKGLAEYFMRMGRPVHVTPTVYASLKENGDIDLYAEPVFECIGAPLRSSHGKVFGVITVFVGDAAQHYQPNDVDVLSVIAAQVSMAVERKQAEATLAISEGRLNRAQSIAHVGDWEVALAGMKVWASAEAFRIYGIEQNTPYLSLQTIQRIVCRADRARLDRALKSLLENNEKYDVEFKINRADNGMKRSIRSIAELERDIQGNPVKIIGTIQDITERKQTEDTLVSSEARYRAVIEQSPEAVMLNDPDTGEIFEANARFSELFGYNLFHDSPINVFDLTLDRRENIEEFMAQLKQTGFLPLQRRVLRHKDGTLVDVERSATLVHFQDRYLVVQTLRDVSGAVRREQEEYRQATHDELTGLYNRRGFAEGVTKLLSTGSSGALLLVDIDDFKLINDVYGHGAGDQYLAAFGVYLSENFRDAALVARFGGDEFILFFAGSDGLFDATRSSAMMEVICLETESGSFFVQLSGGIATLSEQETDLDLQIQRAYLALHHAKESGKWCCKTYEPVQQYKFSRRFAIREALNHAFANEEFRVVFQPIFDIRENTGKIVGYEALLRWMNPKLGEISPAEFIPVAEETNLILPIGKWVLREACRFSVNIGKVYGEYVNVAVNISMRQLAMPNFVSLVKEILHETGLPACNLSLEVTESILMTDATTKISYLEALRVFGVAISLDDFGTGYSSFTYLAQMPITTLKIDKSMVDEIKSGGNRSSLLLESLLHLSALLGYRVVAEGVETQEQLIFLKNKGCGYCQGYLLGRPLPEEEVLAMYGAGKI